LQVYSTFYLNPIIASLSNYQTIANLKNEFTNDTTTYYSTNYMLNNYKTTPPPPPLPPPLQPTMNRVMESVKPINEESVLNFIRERMNTALEQKEI
jgi:hypothetical protein